MMFASDSFLMYGRVDPDHHWGVLERLVVVLLFLVSALQVGVSRREWRRHRRLRLAEGRLS